MGKTLFKQNYSTLIVIYFSSYFESNFKYFYQTSTNHLYYKILPLRKIFHMYTSNIKIELIFNVKVDVPTETFPLQIRIKNYSMLNIRFPFLRSNTLTGFPPRSRKVFILGSLVSFNVPTIRKKIRVFWNKQINSWTNKKSSFLDHINCIQKIPIEKKNTLFHFTLNSFLGTVGLCFQTSRKILKLIFLNITKKPHISTYDYCLAIVGKQWRYSSSSSKNRGVLYFLTKRAAEIYQNPTSKDFFLLTKNQLKAYVIGTYGKH